VIRKVHEQPGIPAEILIQARILSRGSASLSYNLRVSNIDKCLSLPQTFLTITVGLLIMASSFPGVPAHADDKEQRQRPAATEPTPIKPIAIDSQVSTGLLIYKVQPEYPAKAKAARVSGIVTLRAIISKTGEITNLRVVCGPKQLQESSLKAVQQWKYRPYLVHDEPVEIETMIKVFFTLGGKKPLKFSSDSCPAE